MAFKSEERKNPVFEENRDSGTGAKKRRKNKKGKGKKRHEGSDDTANGTVLMRFAMFMRMEKRKAKRGEDENRHRNP